MKSEDEELPTQDGFYIIERDDPRESLKDIAEATGVPFAELLEVMDLPEHEVEVKAAPVADVTKPQELTEWSDAELDAMTEEFTAGDVKESLALRTPEMREILGAQNEEAKPE
ncbi:MAG: hypothetical protein KY445_06295 [Armatimonadetes bacterium]|nr:hypothetical protein [Armatimonadota bacterium]